MPLLYQVIVTVLHPMHNQAGRMNEERMSKLRQAYQHIHQPVTNVTFCEINQNKVRAYTAIQTSNAELQVSHLFCEVPSSEPFREPITTSFQSVPLTNFYLFPGRKRGREWGMLVKRC